MPRSVIEEVVARHTRDYDEYRLEYQKVARRASRIGIELPQPVAYESDYRAFLEDRLGEQIGAILLPWPEVTHSELTRRAVNRESPFKENGAGYRDALVWHSAMALATEGEHVVLASADGDFSNGAGALADVLAAEAATTSGSIELATELTSWLLTQLPWDADNVNDALASTRDAEVLEFLLQTDALFEYGPAPEDLGFAVPWASPYGFAITEVEWHGDLKPLSRRRDPAGFEVVEYTATQTISFEALVPTSAVPDAWRSAVVDTGPYVTEVEGTYDVVATLLVLFGGEEGFSIEQLSWEAPALLPTAFPMVGHHPDQGVLEF